MQNRNALMPDVISKVVEMLKLRQQLHTIIKNITIFRDTTKLLVDGLNVIQTTIVLMSGHQSPKQFYRHHDYIRRTLENIMRYHRWKKHLEQRKERVERRISRIKSELYVLRKASKMIKRT